MMASPPLLMEKSQQQQQSLKCPRCESSNTKFCYYNNYSLSQPRHFCKACKRYWTRGGTLRNVPFGGGCRKNKRLIKKPSSSSSSSISISAVDSPNSSSNPSNNNSNIITSNLVPSSSSNNTILNNPPLFYGMPTNTDTDHHSTHLDLPSFQDFSSRVPVSGFDGLGFSSGIMDYTNNSPSGFNFNPKEIQEVVTSSSVLSRYPMFGSSNLQQHQQKFMGFLPFEDMQMMGECESNGDGSLVNKDVKMEDSRSRLNWSSGNQMDNQIGSTDPSLLWSAPGVGSWLDPSNIGSSVPSLI